MMLREYLRKMRGTTAGSPPRVSNREIFWSWLGSFAGIAAVMLLNTYLVSPQDVPLVLASFGASAVLIYGAPRSPLAQPRNLIGGHVVSALIGVLCWKLLQGMPWLAGALAVSTAIAAMHASKTLHPPGGATALIAVIGSEQVHALGFWYVLAPAAVGPLVLLAVALMINNLTSTRRYPEIWW
jgi:CBS-domain-containing membrane protein